MVSPTGSDRLRPRAVRARAERARPWVLAAVAILSTLLGACRACDGGSLPKPNVIVFISIDTLRADYIGVYGHPRVKTPHLDRLAEQGVRFKQAFTVAPTTLPAHTTMMTGVFPHTHGVPDNGFEVSPSNLMLAEILGAHSYETAGFTGGYPLIGRFGFSQGFDHYAVIESDDRYATDTGDRLTDAVLAWTGQRDRPKLFLFVHYWDVHAPFDPPGRFERMYRNDSMTLTGSFREIGKLRYALQQDREGAAAQSKATKGLYGGEVSWTDTQVGRLLEGLDEQGLFDDALIIFTSDHGESMDSHPREYWYHGNEVFDDTTRIPLIIKLPRSRRAGTVTEAMVSNVDLLPTILELLEIPIPGSVEGKSFAGILSGGAAEASRGPVFSEATKPLTARPTDPGAWINSTKCRGLWTERWKVHHCPRDGYRALYDRSNDPAEVHNLLPTKDPKLRRIHDELAAQLDAWGAGASPEASEKDEDPAVIEQLRALGYVE